MIQYYLFVRMVPNVASCDELLTSFGTYKYEMNNSVLRIYPRQSANLIGDVVDIIKLIVTGLSSLSLFIESQLTLMALLSIEENMASTSFNMRAVHMEELAKLRVDIDVMVLA